MELRSRYNIDDTVFVFYAGRVFKCLVKEIHIHVDTNRNTPSTYYYLRHISNNYNAVNGVRFSEDKVFKDYGELMAMFEIYE